MTTPAAHRPRPAGVIAAVAAANLTRLWRDRTMLFFLVVLPILITLVIGVSIPGGQAADEAALGVVAAPGTGELVEALDDHSALAVRDVATRAELDAAVRRQLVAAGVVLDADVAAALEATSASAEVPFLASAQRSPVATRQAVVAVVTDVVTSGVQREPALAVRSSVVGAQPAASPGGFAHTGPANLVLFVFLNTLVSAGMFATSRRLGVLQRAAAAPVPRGAVLLGEGVSRLLVALVQAAVILVAGAALFGLDWGDPLAVAGVVGLFALVATGAALLLGVVARSDAQATAVAVPVGLVLGMLGGALWPRELVGETMARAGDLTPHGWAMEAFAAVVGAGAGVGDIAGELAVLAGFAVVLLGAAAAVLARRSLRPSG